MEKYSPSVPRPFHQILETFQSNCTVIRRYSRKSIVHYQPRSPWQCRVTVPSRHRDLGLLDSIPRLSILAWPISLSLSISPFLIFVGIILDSSSNSPGRCIRERFAILLVLRLINTVETPLISRSRRIVAGKLAPTSGIPARHISNLSPIDFNPFPILPLYLAL